MLFVDDIHSWIQSYITHGYGILEEKQLYSDAGVLLAVRNIWGDFSCSHSVPHGPTPSDAFEADVDSQD